MAHIEEDYVIHHPSLEGPFKKDGREGESNISDLASRKGFYEGSTVECAICMDDEVPETMTSMNRCGHTFCNDCMNSFILNKIQSREKLSCIDPYCEKDIDEKILDNFIVSPLGSQRMWDQYLIDTDPLVRYCPNNHVVRLQPETWKFFIRCPDKSCRISLCPRCGLRDHPFRSCESASRHETTNAIANLHVKNCPGCKILVEKAGGCDHMTCSHCHQQYCWLCLAPWRSGRCKNRFCKFHAFYDKTGLRRSNCVVKFVAGATALPLVVGAGATAGVLFAAGAVLTGVTLPAIWLVRAPIRVCKERASKRRFERIIREYERQRCVQNGVGITFVGASAKLIEYASNPTSRHHARLLAGESSTTYVLYLDYMYNVHFQPSDRTHSTQHIFAKLPVFSGDVHTTRDQTNENIRHPISREKPHFVFLMHNVGQAEVEYEREKWQSAVVDDSSQSIPDETPTIIDFATRLETLIPNLRTYYLSSAISVLQQLNERELLDISDVMVQNYLEAISVDIARIRLIEILDNARIRDVSRRARLRDEFERRETLTRINNAARNHRMSLVRTVSDSELPNGRPVKGNRSKMSDFTFDIY